MIDLLFKKRVKKNLNILIIFIFSLLFISLVSALQDDAGNSINFDYSKSFNNDTGSVNSSDYWDNLNTPADIDLSSTNDDSGFYVNHTSIVYTLWNALWSLFLKPEVPSAYLYNDSTTIYFNETKLNATIDDRTYGKAIFVQNTSLSAGTYHVANGSWNTNSAMLGFQIVTVNNYNFTICQDTAMTSNCKTYLADSNGNASTLNSYIAYTDEDAGKEVHYTIAQNSGADTYDIKFTGVSA